MRFVLMSLFTLSAIAQTSTDVSNGHLIPEPQLADYHYATRAPGILSEPFEIIDQSGNPSQ